MIIAEAGADWVTVRNTDHGYDGDIEAPFVLGPCEAARLSRSR